MADKEAVAAVVKDESDNGSTSSVFADNECAQALLDLAKSFSPPNGLSKPKNEDMFAPDSLFSISSALYLNGSTDKRKKRDPKCSNNKTSILKRQLEHSERKGISIHSLENYDPNIAVKIEHQSIEELRCELVKRIKLDHNYPCAGDFSWNRYIKALSHPSGDAPNKPPGKSNDGRSKKEHGPGSSQSSGSNGAKNKRTSPDQKNGSGKSPNRAAGSSQRDRNVLHNNNSVSYHNSAHDVTLDKSTEGKKIPPTSRCQEAQIKVEKDTSDQTTTAVVAPDLYQPDDNKYKNFNLLLKCLTTDENLEERASQREGSTDSVKSSSIHDLPSGGSEDGTAVKMSMTFPECSEYQCMCCSRIFQQKRYMTKHMRRMHPEVLGGERRKEDTVACPSCGLSVLRKSFRQHSNVCNLHTKKSKKQLEMDLANCQFCGIRMRRHILVRHLAQEHCVENARDTSLYFSDESDSSTLSGSEHDFGEEEDLSIMGKDCTTFPGLDSASWHSDLTAPRPTSDTPSHQASESTEGADIHPSSREASPPQSSTSKLPKQQELVTCQICGKSFAQQELTIHFKNEHGIDTRRYEDIQKSIADNTLKPLLNVCSHSMLQRFLSDDGDPVNLGITSNEECHSCVQRLVSHGHDDDGYVSSNNNNVSRPSPSAQAVSGVESVAHNSTNVAYTIFIPKKDGQGANTNPPIGLSSSGPRMSVKTSSHSLLKSEPVV